MKKIILAALFLVGIAYAINLFLVSKYKKENDELLQYAMKQERLNIKHVRLNNQLTREAFENYPYKEYSMPRTDSKVFDSLNLLVDSIIMNYPKINYYQRNKFKQFYNITACKKFNLDSILKISSSKLTFELELLTWLNSVGKDFFRRPTHICGSNIMLFSDANTTPIGRPLKFYIGMMSYGTLDISKNLKINIPYKSDSLDKQIGYLKADKIGTYKVEGYYNYHYMGENIKFTFPSFEYTVTEPDIRTTIVDKNYLNLNQDNLVSFNFGRYKSQDIEIAVEGGTFSIVNENTYNIRPTNKKVKIKYSFKNTNNYKALNLGYKEYEAK